MSETSHAQPVPGASTRGSTIRSSARTFAISRSSWWWGSGSCCRASSRSRSRR